MKIEVNQFGTIEEGDNQGWRVYIEDDRLNTGGYLILVTPSQSSEELVAYDHWVDSLASLEQYFREAQWKIRWSSH